MIISGLQSTTHHVETFLKLFSAVKRVKNCLGSSISQTHFSQLSIVYIENDLTQSLDYENIIDRFTECKAKKMPL